MTGNQAPFARENTVFPESLIGWDTNGILYNVWIYEGEPVCYG